MAPRRGNGLFTLIETLVALSILALGLAGLMSLMSSATNRVMKAEAKWGEAHKLAQAAEYFLLCGGSEQIPSFVFPYDGWRAECAIEDAEGLPQGVQAAVGEWRLAKVRITVCGDDGREAKSIAVEKILKNDDCK